MAIIDEFCVLLGAAIVVMAFYVVYDEGEL